MARGVSGKLTVALDLQEFETALGADGRQSVLPARFRKLVEFAAGTTNGQLDRVHSIAPSFTTTPTDVDLAGSLTSPLGGGANTFVDLVLIYIENTSAVGNLLVGGDAASIPLFSATNDVIVIPPGGFFLWYGGDAGITVTATTADILQIAASAGTVNGKVYLAGRSA
jgi:hypothetical protein